MIASIIVAMEAIHEVIRTHPEECQWLLSELSGILSHENSRKTEDVGLLAVMKNREIQAGVAAAISSAVTTFHERVKKEKLP